jgi:hypothetical protein
MTRTGGGSRKKRLKKDRKVLGAVTQHTAYITEAPRGGSRTISLCSFVTEVLQEFFNICSRRWTDGVLILTPVLYYGTWYWILFRKGSHLSCLHRYTLNLYHVLRYKSLHFFAADTFHISSLFIFGPLPQRRKC